MSVGKMIQESASFGLFLTMQHDKVKGGDILKRTATPHNFYQLR